MKNGNVKRSEVKDERLKENVQWCCNILGGSFAWFFTIVLSRGSYVCCCMKEVLSYGFHGPCNVVIMKTDEFLLWYSCGLCNYGEVVALEVCKVIVYRGGFGAF